MTKLARKIPSLIILSIVLYIVGVVFGLGALLAVVSGLVVYKVLSMFSDKYFKWNRKD